MNSSLHERVSAIRLPLGARFSVKVALILSLMLLTQAPAPAFSSPPRAATSIVTGDVIVKFRDASEAGASMAAVLGGTRTVASLAPVAARLSDTLGVPLKLVQVTSGREALLAIDRDALMRSLAERAAREPGVVRAITIPAAAAGLPSEQASVRVELTPQAVPQALAAKLASGSLLRPRLHNDSTGATLLSYDMVGLTLTLLERLQQQPEVEYAQANRLLRAVDADKPR
jgi:hypothetical protein